MPEPVRNTIRFLLDGEQIQLTDVDPNRTVLQWLREDRQRTGTKEGCAEGDCGACAVVVAELETDGETLRYRAINSCIQFLVTLDGKELITVESLRHQTGHLHPVQQAMVDAHGSQCGFCTPGFVMSLYALYQSIDRPSRQEIDDALAGNLCRCTGYKPIVSAASKMYDYARPSGDRPASIAALKGLRTTTTLQITGNGRRYFAPRTIAALSDLVQAYPDAQLLAGGTDVGLWVTKEHRSLDALIYLGGVAELLKIGQTDTHLELGAAVALTDAMPALISRYPGLSEVLHRFAAPPIRNVATIGGNIANGSPIGDSMPALIALGATLVLRSGGATRELPLEEFYLGYRKTALARCEFVERIRIPLLAADQHFQTYKVSKRFDQDISAVCAAFCLTLDGDRVGSIRIAYGGVAAVPVRAPACEQALTGVQWTEQSVAAAASAMKLDFQPISDMRATASYRARVSANLLLRFFYQTRVPDPPVSLFRYGRQ